MDACVYIVAISTNLAGMLINVKSSVIFGLFLKVRLRVVLMQFGLVVLQFLQQKRRKLIVQSLIIITFFVQSLLLSGNNNSSSTSVIHRISKLRPHLLLSFWQKMHKSAFVICVSLIFARRTNSFFFQN